MDNRCIAKLSCRRTNADVRVACGDLIIAGAVETVPRPPIPPLGVCHASSGFKMQSAITKLHPELSRSITASSLDRPRSHPHNSQEPRVVHLSRRSSWTSEDNMYVNQVGQQSLN
jgi:hypothetical protein